MNVLNVISGLSDGGAEAVLYRLCTGDTHNRHTVISLMDNGKYGDLLAEKGISVHALGMPRGRATISGLLQLWQLIRRIRPNVIQTWMYHANLLGGVVGRLAGQHNIVWGIHHTDLSSGNTARHTVVVAKLCAWLSDIVPRRVVYCAETARRVHEAFGYSSARSCSIPNGYDLSVFRPDPEKGRALRAALGIDVEHRVIGFIARFDPLKDHATLLDALVLLRQRRASTLCLLVGSGMETGNVVLAEMIVSRGLSETVILLGRRNDIPAVMNALDIHVMSSMCEAFPNVLAEAMACGTPCVSTDVGDAAVILGGTGRVVAPREPAALADALDDMLGERDSQSWSAHCMAARRHVAEHFSVGTMVARYCSVWSGDATLRG